MFPPDLCAPWLTPGAASVTLGATDLPPPAAGYLSKPYLPSHHLDSAFQEALVWVPPSAQHPRTSWEGLSQEEDPHPSTGPDLHGPPEGGWDMVPGGSSLKRAGFQLFLPCQAEEPGPAPLCQNPSRLTYKRPHSPPASHTRGPGPAASPPVGPAPPSRAPGTISHLARNRKMALKVSLGPGPTWPECAFKQQPFGWGPPAGK